jgi:hypothetical protein
LVGWIIALTFAPSLLVEASLSAVMATLAYIGTKARKIGIWGDVSTGYLLLIQVFSDASHL